jgi:Fe-only nitrogenase accessory protein AnfO
MTVAREIAVFIDGEGSSASLLAAGKIIVYRKNKGSWQAMREMDFTLQQRGIREMRRQMAEVITFLDGCGVFVAQAVSGVPYFELEKAQLAIWEFSGQPRDFLDYVSAQEEAKQEVMPQLAVVPAAEEREPGAWFISIKEIQETDRGVTSKQVLLPIIRKKNFNQLEVLCNHIPPWLELELLGTGLSVAAEKIDAHSYRVMIKKVCAEDIAEGSYER